MGVYLSPAPDQAPAPYQAPGPDQVSSLNFSLIDLVSEVNMQYHRTDTSLCSYTASAPCAVRLIYEKSRADDVSIQ